MEAAWPFPVEFEAASKPIAAWAPDARTRRITVEKRTIRVRRKIEYTADFTGYALRTSTGSIFWQGLFIMSIKVQLNKL
jgi:hypothetical protein